MNDPIRIAEEKHLSYTTEQISKATQELTERLKAVGAENLEKLVDLRANPETGTDFEMFLYQLNEKNQSFNIKDKYARLEELQYLSNNPYFARIDLKTDLPDVPPSIYIGKFGYGTDEQLVTDWRASIASIYYRYRFPQKNVEFKTIEGTHQADLELKRTFDIHNGQLIKYYNNDIQLDENEIIIEKVKERTGGVLEDIVETIQKDQMDIIEADPRQICIVQGCVGSGKSTVAIHKLAHIFFNYANYIHPERAILVVKNQILIGYLATLFPKLGIFDINFKTLRDLIVNAIFREQMAIQVDMDDAAQSENYGIAEIEQIYRKIKSVHKLFEEKIAKVFIDPELESYGGYKYSSETSVYENLEEIFDDINEEIESLKEVIKDNPQSIRAVMYKSNVAHLRKVLRRINDLKYTLKNEVLKEVLQDLKIDTSKKLNYADTLIYMLVYRKLIGFNKTLIYEYCTIDEGQDFSLLEYAVLNGFVLRGRFGIFGDLNQMMFKDGIGSWDEIQKVIPEAKKANVFKLDTNYRSTKQIIAVANKIMGKYDKQYLPKSINRSGPDPHLIKVNTKDDIVEHFQTLFASEVQDIAKSIGIICGDNTLISKVRDVIAASKLDPSKFVLLDSSKRISYLPKGVYLMDMEDCKGLEFAKVYLLGVNLDKINNITEARRAFVGVTRAMNELTVITEQ
jgi:DNA helicase II / ATP-dependent DNA helicase PcrA